MRKMLVLLLVMALLLSLTACGEKEEPASEEKHSSNQADKETKPTQPEETTAPDVPEREFSIGKVTGQNYENTFIGIGCTLPENWTFSTEQELLQQNGLSGTSIGPAEQEALRKSTFFHDMNASFQGQFPCIYVYMEKKSAISLSVTTSESHYMKILDSFTKRLNKDGIKTVEGSVEEVSVAGQTIPCLRIKAKISGMVYYWTIICFECNNYIATLEINTNNKSDARDILNCFYFIEA